MSEETSRKNKESKLSVVPSSSSSESSNEGQAVLRSKRTRIKTDFSKKISNEPKIEMLDDSNEEIEEIDNENTERQGDNLPEQQEVAKKKTKSKWYTKRGSKMVTGYAAALINLKEKPVVVPSIVDMKKIKSSLAPLFKNK